MAEISYAYIQVDGDGAVQNIAMFENYEDANRITRAVYGDQAFAAEYRYAVRPGGVDRFHDGRFWTVAEDGTETKPSTSRRSRIRSTRCRRKTRS